MLRIPHDRLTRIAGHTVDCYLMYIGKTKNLLRKLLSKPEMVFASIAVVFGIASSLILPLFASPDEGYHFYGSYAVFSSDGDLPRDILLNPFVVMGGLDNGTYGSYFDERIDFEDDNLGLALNRDLTQSPDGYINVPEMASITDISHLPQSIGIAIAKLIYPSVGFMLVAGRLFNLAFFVVALYIVIKKVRFAKWVFVFVGLLPMIVHQAGSLSYDVMNIVVIFAFMALMVNLYTQKTPVTKKQIGVLLVLCAALLITKPTNVALLLFIPFLPYEIYRDARLVKYVRNRLSKRILIAAALVSLIAAVALLALYAGKFLSGHEINIVNLIKAIVRTYSGDGNPELDPIITTGIVGNFSWSYYRFPEWIVLLNFLTLTIILLREKVVSITTRFALISAASLVVYILAVTAGMYLTWTTLPFVLGENAKYVAGLQGRYFTPLLLLLIPCAAYLQKRLSVHARDRDIALLVVFVSCFSLTYYLLASYRHFYL